MSTAIAIAKSESVSKQSVKRSTDHTVEEVAISFGHTYTEPFADFPDDIATVAVFRRPSRSAPVNQHGGFSSKAEKTGWEAASDEAWESIDD
jgi:hypothetical protein